MGSYLEESKHWIARAQSTLAASEQMFKNEFYPESISRSYYAMFYAAKALLTNQSTVTRKHRETVREFQKLILKEGAISDELARHFQEALDLRITSDYDVYWKSNPDLAKQQLHRASRFIDSIKTLLSS